MFLALLLSMAVAQTPDAAELVSQQRLVPRKWFSASGIVSASGGAGLGFGLGIQMEVGATFRDWLSVGFRAFAATLVIAVDCGATIGVDARLNDLFSVGIGAGARFYASGISPAALSVGVPIRLQFHPFVRGADQVQHANLVLGLEAVPAVAIASWGGRVGGSPVPAPALSGMLTVGYLWW